MDRLAGRTYDGRRCLLGLFYHHAFVGDGVGGVVGDDGRGLGMALGDVCRCAGARLGADVAYAAASDGLCLGRLSVKMTSGNGATDGAHLVLVDGELAAAVGRVGFSWLRAGVVAGRGVDVACAAAACRFLGVVSHAGAQGRGGKRTKASLPRETERRCSSRSSVADMAGGGREQEG